MRINLLPVEERPLDTFAIRWEFVAILLGIVLLVLVNGYGLMRNLQVRTLNFQYNGIVEENMFLKMQRNEVNAIQEKNRVLENKLKHYQEITSMGENSISLKSILEITECIPTNVWIDDLQLQSEMVVIYGYTVSTATVSQFLRNLSDAGFDANVRNFEQIAGNVTRFSIDVKGG